jgi:scavenger receptor class B protein 1
MAFMSSLLEIHQQNLFVRKSVGELLFYGYRLDFIDSLQAIARPLEMFGFKFPIAQGFPNNRFAVYLGRNNTPSGPYEVYTGVGSIATDSTSKKTGQIYKWKNKTSLDWFGDTCNSLRSTDGTRFPPFVGRDRDLIVLSSEACRTVRMRFTRPTSEQQIPADRFELAPEQFLKPQLNPSNRCYCKNQSKVTAKEIDPCSMSGLLDLSKCWFGAPILASKPHFYQVDAMFGNATIRQMRPNASKHESFIHVEPVSFPK